MNDDIDSKGTVPLHPSDLCEEDIALNAWGNNFKSTPFEGHCDWCGEYSAGLIMHRDLDEGMHGPLYQVCLTCIRKETEAAYDELADSDWDAWFDEDD